MDADSELFNEALELLGYRRGRGTQALSWKNRKVEVFASEDKRFHVRSTNAGSPILFSADTGVELVQKLRLAHDMFESRL